MTTLNHAFKVWSKFRFVQPRKRLRYGTVPHINFEFYGLGIVSGRRANLLLMGFNAFNTISHFLKTISPSVTHTHLRIKNGTARSRY